MRDVNACINIPHLPYDQSAGMCQMLGVRQLKQLKQWDKGAQQPGCTGDATFQCKLRLNQAADAPQHLLQGVIININGHIWYT
jgi:hypothetical protein